MPAPPTSRAAHRLLWVLAAAVACALVIAAVVALLVPEPAPVAAGPPESEATTTTTRPRTQDGGAPGRGEELVTDAGGTLSLVVPSDWAANADTISAAPERRIVTFSAAPRDQFLRYGSEGMLVAVVPKQGPISHDMIREELLGYVSSAGPRMEEQCNLQGLISIPGVGDEKRPASTPAEAHEDWLWEDWTECKSGLVENVYAFAATDPQAVVIVAVRTTDTARGDDVLGRAVETLDVTS